MPSDQATFLLSFAALFAAIAWYAWRLQRLAARLQERLASLEATGGGGSEGGSGGGNEPATRAKKGQGPGSGQG